MEGQDTVENSTDYVLFQDKIKRSRLITSGGNGQHPPFFVIKRQVEWRLRGRIHYNLTKQPGQKNIEHWQVSIENEYKMPGFGLHHVILTFPKHKQNPIRSHTWICTAKGFFPGAISQTVEKESCHELYEFYKLGSCRVHYTIQHQQRWSFFTQITKKK